MAAIPGVRHLDTVNLLANASPPCSSPTKRCSTSPGPESEGHARVLRAKLSIATEEDCVDVESPHLVHDPSTPPDSRDDDNRASKETQPVLRTSRVADFGEGATQTATAERQTRELGELSYSEQNLLARLCSQHPASEYNNLKRAVAAAAVPGNPQMVQHIHAQVPPIPPFRHAQSAGPSTFPTLRPALPARTASASLLATPQPVRASCNVLETSSNGQTPPPRSTLTPSLARVNFEFSLNAQPTTSVTPVQVEQCSAADNSAMAVLDDLVEGEPVTVAAPRNRSVATETVSAPLPLVEYCPNVPGLLPGMELMNGVPVKTSMSHPINISPLVPPELLSYFSNRVFAQSAPAVSSQMPSGLATVSEPTTSAFLLAPQPACDLLTLVTPVANGVCPIPPHSVYAAPNSPKIGNFMLSSCPGKKVRMNGESLKGGRGAICRDVKIDLQRAKDEGVRMIICCLDDSELAFLGTPYPEYAAACETLELQVLRIPMVEGFAPASAASLDAQLDRLIRNHTLNGESVLAHCRGGIGRAGLVATCWLIKMGMVATSYGLYEQASNTNGWMHEQPIVIVERAIDLIRRRRSVKSIETTHQVKFLLEYVRYLQDHARFASASQLVHA
ncbi:uncharacterized protein JCM15063_006192 [Sporobolomyces koalae]|uniref:uncharacterized protein n=1 Tax=Sporobolomyces koalae TaxID=500713 RepID=UPI0031757D2C